jgi:RNA polymerase sigma-70 factor (ECF subfamily)
VAEPTRLEDRMDSESRRWLERLRPESRERDAAIAELRDLLLRLDQFRGESQFTTWAYKFALYEAAAKMRKRSWQGRELPLEAEDWPQVPDPGPAPEGEVEMNDLLAAIREEIEASLTQRQRKVFVALALNEVPIDVLAERLDTTRGALYKVLHDARKRLRAALVERDMIVSADQMEENL